MYCNIKDIVEDRKSEEQLTLKLFAKLTDDIKQIKAHEDIRSLERLAWHITHTLTEMPFRAGLLDADILDNQPIPERLEDIIKTYKEHSAKLIDLIQNTWTDKDLFESVEAYGQQWEKRMILWMLTKHEAHHRGQMSALMRVQGIEVPGIYGPSKEEWVKYGMEAHP